MGCVQGTQLAVVGTRVAAGLKRGYYLQTHDNKTGDEWLMTDACKFKPEALGNNTTQRKVGGNPPTFSFQIQEKTGFCQRSAASALPFPTMAFTSTAGKARIRSSWSLPRRLHNCNANLVPGMLGRCSVAGFYEWRRKRKNRRQ